MTQAHRIRNLFFEEGKTVSQISRETGRDRKTIREYLAKEDWNVPVPQVTPQPAFPKLAPYKAVIDEWLEEDRNARKTQRHTARLVHKRLQTEYPQKYNCSYRTVASYVAFRKEQIYGPRKSFLPLEHPPGEAQADFGEADFFLGTRKITGHYLNLSFPYSNHGYLQLYRGENQQCLFEGLASIFRHMGGVPTRIWFDNASTMVTKILKGGKRQLTDAFLRFQEHYGFEAAFCNACSGHEKGHVESKVGYHRRNLLVPVPHVDDLAEFNQTLLQECDKLTYREHYRKGELIADLYQEDKKPFRPLPRETLDLSHYLVVRTNAYGRFFLEGGLHEYSVGPRYAQQSVLVKLTAEHVTVLDESHRPVVTHERLYGKTRQQSMQWLPYLTQLSRRPGALKYTGIHEMLPEPLRDYLDHYERPDQGKVLRVIAALTQDQGFESAIQTVSSALEHGAYDPDSLVSLHKWLHTSGIQMQPLVLDTTIPDLAPVKPDLTRYDTALGQEDDRSC